MCHFSEESEEKESKTKNPNASAGEKHFHCDMKQYLL